MKHSVRTLMMASLMMLVLNACDSFPITQEGKVKKVATAYIEQGLKDGESMKWGGCGLRLHIHMDGRTYTYTKVKYTISSDGNEESKTLYLLLSENSDELYAATDKKGGDLQNPIWQAANRAMRQSYEDASNMMNEELPFITK